LRELEKPVELLNDWNNRKTPCRSSIPLRS
jgi:hypothetical protein